MSAPTPNITGHSAKIEMHLRVNGQTFSIGQLGPDFLILDDPADHPPARGEVMVSIDGRERRWSVWLPEGVRAGRGMTAIGDTRSVA